MSYILKESDKWGQSTLIYYKDSVCKTMIYTDKDNKYLKEKHEETFKKLEADPEATEEEKERIWRAIQEISRGY